MLSVISFIFLLATCYVVAEKDHFRAAILEHRIRGNQTIQNSKEIIEENLNIYRKAAKVAAKRSSDIIVFSEFGIFPYNKNRSVLKSYMEHVPNPKNFKRNPCKEKDAFYDRPILTTLSCIAQKHKMYVVANMGDIQPCTAASCNADSETPCDFEDCPKDGAFMYNTDVAFDRDGCLIARYHKNHLYFEVLNTPKTPEFITFDTDFGVFGMIVCFDSLFKHSVTLVEDYKVETLLFPTHWFDDIVPLNAIEFQQSWAITNNVNFIAANGHLPGLGTLGSGIYSKHGALSYTYYPDGNSKLLIADVPNKKHAPKQELDDENEVFVITENDVRKEDENYKNFPLQWYDKLIGPPHNNFTDYRCYKAQASNYNLTKLKDASGDLESCNNGFCCTVKYKANSMDEDYYLAAFNGTNDVRGYFKWAEESCMLVRCDAHEGKPCVSFPSKAKTVFEMVEMKAKFTTKYVYPAVSENYYRLAPLKEWNIEHTENGISLNFHSISNKPLLKVALMGRVYERDPPFIPFHRY